MKNDDTLRDMQNLSIISSFKHEVCVEDNDNFHLRFFIGRLVYCGYMENNSKSYAQTSYSQHSHSYYEYNLTLSGSVEYEVEGRKIEVPPGSFIIFPPNTMHQINYEKANFSKITLSFDFEPKKDGECYGFYKVFERECKKVNSYTSSNEMDWLISRLATNAAIKGNDSENLILHYLAAFFIENARVVVGDKYKNTDLQVSDERIYKAMDFVSMKEGVGVCVEDIANHLHISTKQLNRIFDKELGVSPAEYVRKEKIKYVRFLLEETNLSLSEIADMSGYSSEYALNRTFAALEGKSMGKYRKDLRFAAHNTMLEKK